MRDRSAGRKSVGVAGAVAIIGVLAVAIADVPAGVAVALIGGVIFDVVVSYAQPPDPFAFGLPLIAVWTLSALAGGAAAVRLRAQAQRGVSEAVALHRELVGSLVPTPRLRRVDVSVASVYRPGEQRLELGGDFYAAIERADGGIALLVGDVSGHGAAAAGLAAMLRAGWEALVEAGVTPAARLQSLNRLLLAHASYEEFFATVCSVVIDPSLNTATIALAGHPAPLLTSAGAPVRFDLPTGAPLGINEQATWAPTTVALPRPFSLLLYTDGVIEGRAAPGAGERFGEQRLRDLVCSSTAGGRELLVQILLAASSAHGGALPDDAALLLLEHSGRSRSAGDATARMIRPGRAWGRAGHEQRTSTPASGSPARDRGRDDASAGSDPEERRRPAGRQGRARLGWRQRHRPSGRDRVRPPGRRREHRLPQRARGRAGDRAPGGGGGAARDRARR